MCGRFYIDSEMWEEIQTIAGEIDRRLCAVPQRRDIFPSQEPPVLDALGLSGSGQQASDQCAGGVSFGTPDVPRQFSEPPPGYPCRRLL